MPLGTPDIIRPFRWNIARRNELGSLLKGPHAESWPGFIVELRRTTALAVARSGPGTIVFVGRSLESSFDYLSGIVEGLEPHFPLKLLQVSFSAVRDIEATAAQSPAEFAALTAYMRAEGLSATDLTVAAEPTTFVDIVATGGTFGTLVGLLRLMCRTERADWNVVERRIGFTGVVIAGKTSPNTWRWWQHEPWVAELKKPRISNVSIPGYLWGFLGNNAEKVTRSHSLWRWADPASRSPDHADEHTRALRLAVSLYDRGLARDERSRFADELARLPEMRHAWLRRLVTALRRAGGRR